MLKSQRSGLRAAALAVLPSQLPRLCDFPAKLYHVTFVGGRRFKARKLEALPLVNSSIKQRLLVKDHSEGAEGPPPPCCNLSLWSLKALLALELTSCGASLPSGGICWDQGWTDWADCSSLASEVVC
ncbi:hypothetical protein AOLI_G00283820 [Acnodon oligacanthus]